MPGQNFQSEGEDSISLGNSMCLQVVNEFGEQVDQFSLAVKTLTTNGIILNIEQVADKCRTGLSQERNVLFKVYSPDIGGMVELPGIILWTRTNGDDAALTLGLELADPLPLSVRNILEENLSTVAQDMKLLWDYWDETKKPENPADLSEPVDSDHVISEALAASENPDISTGKSGNLIYWLGFGAILSGLALQFPQLEYLSFSGLVMMFGGSLIVAWKSVMSMRQKLVD